MKLDLKNHKTCVFGIQESGKTYLVENSLIKSFKRPLVYRMHKDEFNKTGKNVLIYDPPDYTVQTLDKFIVKVIAMGKAGEIDALIIDEADMFLQNTGLIPQNVNDLVINHRHYGLAVVLISRRPQDIPTKIIESCKHIFVFKIEGENVMKKLKSIHPHFEEQMQKLELGKYNFIYKLLGNPPKVFNRINIKNKELKKNEKGKS